MDAASEAHTGAWRRHRTTLAVAALLAAYWVMAVTAVRTKSATYDERVYVTGGYAYWTRNDYRLNAESGHLPQRIAALPLLLTDPAFPEPEHPGWRWGDALSVGWGFLHESGNDPDAIVLPARLACATFSALLGLLVFAWSRRLFGVAGGLVSLTLFAFCPTMLGNGPIPQSDVAAALFFSAAVVGMWATLHRLSPLRLLASCAAFAGLFLSKLSAPVVVVIGLVLIVLRVADGRPLPVAFGRERFVRGRWRLAVASAALVALHAAVVWGAVWAAYGFRFAACNDDDAASPDLMRDAILHYTAPESTAWARPVLAFAHEYRVLPEAYLFGVAFQVYHTTPEARRFGFLNGEVYAGGKAAFFPYCGLVKTPLPLFALLALAAWGWWRVRRTPGAATLHAMAPALVLLAVYALVTARTPVNIGHRYLAPLYPPLFVLAGAAAWWFRPAARPTGRRWPAVGVAALLAAFVVESLATWPHYLAYFNPLAGGPKTGYRRLVDSSLDWGQDLPGLRRWLDERGLPSDDTPVYLGYFGTAGVRHHGVRAVPLYTYPHQPLDAYPESLTGGVYCVSATLLAGVYLKQFGGAWTAEYEARYRGLLELVGSHRRAEGSPERQAALYRGLPETAWSGVCAELNEARFARLCAYLRTREPDDTIGYSILTFRLTDDEVRTAVGP